MHSDTFFSHPDKPHSSKWEEREIAFNRELLQAFFNQCILDYKDEKVQLFKGFLKQHYSIENADEIIADARTTKDFKNFYNELKDINMLPVNNHEKLVKLQPNTETNLTEADSVNLKEYMAKKKISASVCFVEKDSALTTINSAGNESSPIFAIHSVGKVFAGMLVLTMIKENVLTREQLDNPVELHESDMALLPPNVQKFLAKEKVTLHQLMIHESGLGDYLKNYNNALLNAIKDKQPIPKMENPEDFLKFAEDATSEKGRFKYSNLGTLLVGLAIKHAYAKKYGPLSYNEILRKHIIQPAGMTVFSATNPQINVKTGKDAAPFIAGSPAGGYWTTAADLAKFGHWIYQQAKYPEMERLLEKYGEEFYDKVSQVAQHPGGIESASAYLSVNLVNGMSVACLSDQPRVAGELNGAIQLNVVCADYRASLAHRY